jgi:hypothetical protein
VRKRLARWDFILPSLLALGHVGLYFSSVRQSPDGWAGFVVFIVDVPISIPLLMLAKALSLDKLVVLLVGGTIWWFVLGILISILIKLAYGLIVRAGMQICGSESRKN